MIDHLVDRLILSVRDLPLVVGQSLQVELRLVDLQLSWRTGELARGKRTEDQPSDQQSLVIQGNDLVAQAAEALEGARAAVRRQLAGAQLVDEAGAQHLGRVHGEEIAAVIARGGAHIGELAAIGVEESDADAVQLAEAPADYKAVKLD